MATKATATKKTTDRKVSAEKILSRYVEFVLDNGHEPATVYTLCKELKINEKEFYRHFGSLAGVHKAVWKNIVEKTAGICREDTKFDEFSAREKLLAYYYTLVESLSEYRTFVLWSLNSGKKIEPEPSVLSEAKKDFMSFCQEIIISGLETEEIIDRPLIGKRYKEGMWVQFLFVVQFWRKDDSKEFEKTDAAIEKSVNLSFELMGKSALDSVIDFGKFLYQNRS